MIVSAFVLFISLSNYCTGYAALGRFGHSAVLVNDSIYFYGGDTSIVSSTSTPSWVSDLAILPINVPFSLTDLPWKPASGPQNSVGGPIVYSHTAFVGGPNGGNMIIVGGVMPTTEKSNSDDESIAYTYDCDIGRWNTFSLPTQNYLNRQGAASSISSSGIAHIWGGKRASLSGTAPSSSPSTSTSTTAIIANTTTTTTTTAVKPRLPATVYQIDSQYPSNSTMSPVASMLPPLRYGHTQTLINDKTIVILGGFDSVTGDALSLADIWLYDIPTSTWTHEFAALDNDNKPANRSSHSQVLMPDGVSILMQHRYGGYDGYHVYNDVAVLDTRTWSWTIKNTNAAVQGRADHTATLVGTNMVVAFGFTGVSTSLTVMSDIEVLDTITWSWTSFYIPSNGYGDGTNPNSGVGDRDKNVAVMANTPSMAIVAGAVTGVLVVLVLIIVGLYMFNYHQRRSKSNMTHHRQASQGRRQYRQRQHNNNRSNRYWISPDNNNNNNNREDSFMRAQYHRHHDSNHNDSPIFTKDIDVNAVLSPSSSSSPLSLPRMPTPNRSHLGRAPTQLQIATNPEIINYPIMTAQPHQYQYHHHHHQQQQHAYIPSPWTPITRQSFPPAASDLMIRRAATIPYHFHGPCYLNKPDEPFTNVTSKQQIRRAATTPHAAIISSTTTNNNNKSDNNSDDDNRNISNHFSSSSICEMRSKPDNSDKDDLLFDQQEFVLRSADDDSHLFAPGPLPQNNSSNDQQQEGNGEELTLQDHSTDLHYENQETLSINESTSTSSKDSSGCNISGTETSKKSSSVHIPIEQDLQNPLQRIQQPRLFLSVPSLDKESQSVHERIMFFQQHSK